MEAAMTAGDMDGEFRDRVLADLARLEKGQNGIEHKLDRYSERITRIEERVALRAAAIGAGVVLVGWLVRGAM